MPVARGDPVAFLQTRLPGLAPLGGAGRREADLFKGETCQRHGNSDNDNLVGMLSGSPE